MSSGSAGVSQLAGFGWGAGVWVGRVPGGAPLEPGSGIRSAGRVRDLVVAGLDRVVAAPVKVFRWLQL